MSQGLYQVDAMNLEDLKDQLNFILQRIADRLDKLEGIRDKADLVGKSLEVAGDVTVLDSDSQTIHSME